MFEIIAKFANEFWVAISEMAPYLLFGFLVAGILSVLISPGTVERHIGKSGLKPVLKASMFGVPLPLCSCGVIPVGMSLRKHGASRDATVSFLISTPQTGVDSIMVTLSMLGPVFAIVRPLAALATGIIGGLMTMLFGERDSIVKAEQPRENAASCSTTGKCEDSCCDTSGGKSRPARAIEYGFVTLPRDIGKFMMYGLLLAALITIIVPDDFFNRYFGAGITPMLMMMLVGIPMYVCSSASVPIVAALMHHAGLSPGAALVFLMTGPATNAATITAIWKILGRRTALVYLLSIALGALLFGLLLDSFITPSSVSMGMHNHWMMPHWVNTISAIVLIPLLMQSFFRKHSVTAEKTNHSKESDSGGKLIQNIRLNITGMTCSHCAASVTRALDEFDNVFSVKVDLKEGTADISGTNLDTEKLAGAVNQLGYNASLKT